MGILCCLYSSRVRVAPESKQQVRSYTDVDASSAAWTAVKVAKDSKTDARDIDAVEQLRKTAAAAAAALDALLAGVLIRARLADTGIAAGGRSSSLQTHPKLPADLQELLTHIAAACNGAQCTAASFQSTAAELSSCMLEHFNQQQQQQQQQRSAVQRMQVPSADTLVNALSMVVYSQVTLDSATVLQRRYKQYSQLLSSLGLQHSGLAACVQPFNKAVLACLLLAGRAPAGEARVSCVVQRRSAFWDALQHLQQQGIVQPDRQQQVAGAVQLAKLFPRFVDEQLLQQQQQQSGHGTVASIAVEGGEGHGPRKEFFHLVGQNWSRAGHKPGQPALFVHLRGAGTWWLNSTLSCSPQLRAAYWAVGWLLAQALANRCVIDLQLAPLLLHHLLLQPHDGFKPSLAMLQQHDPEAAQGLQAVLQLPEQQYQQLLLVEGRPGSTSKQQYIDLALQQLLIEDVAWQLDAVQRGFYATFDRQVLLDCCFDAASLAIALCGEAADESADFQLLEVFRLVLEDDAGGNSRSDSRQSCEVAGSGQAAATGVGTAQALSSEQLVLQCLWQVLATWDPQQKRAFVKFVTGSSRLPAPGSEQLLVSFPFVAYSSREQAQLLGTLPQSHTCANTLELPNYPEALTATDPQLMHEWQQYRDQQGWGGDSSRGCPSLTQRCCDVLQERLLVAVSSCNSYGLDALA